MTDEARPEEPGTESGVDEVYVQSFPLSGAKFQISAGGGCEPQWRRDGSEVFFIGADRMLMAAPITFPHTTSEPLQIGQPKPLIPVPLIDTFFPDRTLHAVAVMRVERVP